MVLARTNAEPLSGNEIQERVSMVLEKILSYSNPEHVILFGSAASGKMTQYSDLDFVVVVKSKNSIRETNKALSKISFETKIPIDFLVVDQERYLQKSEIGGVFFDARCFGKTLFRAEQ